MLRVRPSTTRASVVAGLLTLVACSAGGGTTAAGSAGPPPPVTADEARVLWDAEQSLLRDCMARHGFEYWAAPHDPIPEDRDFPYVVDDVGWARRHGYGSDIVDRIDRLRDQNPNRRYLEALPAQRRKAAFTALNGEGPRPGTVKRRPDQLEVWLPTGGVVRRSALSCTSQAQRQLYGDLPEWYRATRTLQNLDSVRTARVHRDPRFTSAVAAWSACMRERGHPYADPSDARAEALAQAPTGPEAREKEISTAVAEATCAGTAGLAAVARDLDEQYARDIAQRYRREVRTERRLQRAALPRALTITAAGPSPAGGATQTLIDNPLRNTQGKDNS
ncbi:hypothetical protein [Nonomuraea jiangxiensis]|uniref:Secreted protein n=1 Tax=Nonomuraea jiangxiensis TaxID=633440 RepID=A0A1G8QR58_9ACTN|nr:hypothetical protein [Nonomuraea jiangxiensis]SDJ07143.1 hypothetical protein SAMN05421869_108333 [Nonomuraea jiangxiensis]